MTTQDILVGPTKCDEDRKGRNDKIDQIIVDFTANVNSDTTGAILDGIIFFREALGCFQNRNYAASIAMCGASVENLLLDLLLLDHKYCIKGATGTVTWSTIQEIKDGKFRDYLRELVDRPDGSYNKRNEVITKARSIPGFSKLEKEVEEVLEYRDTAVHYTENTFRKFFRATGTKKFNNLQLWPFNEENCEKTLKKTLDLISFSSGQFADKLPCKNI